MKEIVEEAAYKSIEKNNPALLQIIRTFLAHGFSPEQILGICARKSKLPIHRLAFIGCAADYLIRMKNKSSDQ